MPDTSLTLVIAGAGIGGLVCAIACAKRGFSVEVVEQASTPGDTGAGIQLGPNAMHVLAALGLSNRLETAAFSPKNAVFRRYDTGRPLLMSALNPEHERRYGQKYLHIHRADLHSALLGAARSHGVTLHFGEKVHSFERSDSHVALISESNRYSADVLVGADGIHSAVRNQLVGSAPARFTEQVAWRGLIESDRLPEGLLSPDANVWMGPGKHFVAYYVRAGRLINFVAVQEQADWTEESWQLQGDIGDVRAAFHGWDPVIDTLLGAGDTCYQWGLFDRPALARWQNDRVVLLGDACHPMLPFMAQGAAMAIEDAWVLSELLAVPHASLEQALKRYETVRQPRTAAIQALSAKNARTYHHSNGVNAVVRNLGFAVASALPVAANVVLDRVYGLDVTKTLA